MKSKPKGKDFEAWEIPKKGKMGLPWVSRAENRHPGAASAVTATAPPHDLSHAGGARARGRGPGPGRRARRGRAGRSTARNPPPRQRQWCLPTPGRRRETAVPRPGPRGHPPKPPALLEARDLQEAAGSGRLTKRGAPDAKSLRGPCVPPSPPPPAPSVRKDVRAPALCLRRLDVTLASQPHPRPPPSNLTPRTYAPARARQSWAWPRGAGR